MPDRKSEQKKKDILKRIESLETAIAIAEQYVKTGEHAHWHGFSPLFKDTSKGDKVRPPHKDWVKSTFLPKRKKALVKAENILDRLEN